MKRKHRLLILLSLFAMMLCLMFTASAYADGERQFAPVDLYIEGEFPVHAPTTYRLRASDFDTYIRNSISNQEIEIDVSQYGMSPDEFHTVYQNLLNRSPWLFYVSGYYYYYTGDLITSIEPVYLYSGSDLNNRISKFNAAVDEIVNYARQSSTVIGQLLRANDYFCANYEYDLTYSIYSPDKLFEQKTGVCQAYTMAYGAVLEKLGVTWTTTASDAMNHIWNMVYLDGEWYHIDVTWNDPTEDVPLRVCHDNFLLSDTALADADHYSWDRHTPATSTKYDNYFWKSVNHAIPIVGDTAYYIIEPSSYSSRDIYKANLGTGSKSRVYSFTYSGSTYWPGYHPLWADDSYLYYADCSKLYRVPHSGGSATQVYNTGNSNKWIWGMFQRGTTLSMHVSSSPSTSGSIHTLTVSSSTVTPQAVKITKQPVSVTVNKGQTATVSVSATGDGLEYLWVYKDPGSDWYYDFSFTGNTYSVTMSEYVNGRQVFCFITDEYGNSVESNIATLSMSQSITITKQPVSVTVTEGQTATVSVSATGDGLEYYWVYKDPDGDWYYDLDFTGTTYSITMSKAVNGRQVFCLITDKHGNSVESNIASLCMAESLKIIYGPSSVGVRSGEVATVTCTATGEGLTYKWYYKDTTESVFHLAPSFTGSTYSITMSSARNGRQVYCVVSDKYGNSLSSDIATLTMAQELAITRQPVSVVVPEGETATVSCSVSGDGLFYKWYCKRTTDSQFTWDISYTSNTFSVPMSQKNDGMQVYCVIIDKYDYTIQTNTVTLSMGSAAKIVTQPVSASANKGETATVYFTAAGDGLTYKWYYKDKTDSDFLYSSSFTGSTYSIAMSDARNGRQVYCVVTDKYGNSVKTNTVTLTMTQSLAITKQPVSVTVGKGQTATVSFTAAGEGLTYKWYYKDKTDSDFLYSSSFTGNTYSIAMSDARNGRQVYCVVTDKYGNSVRTNTVTINMTQALAITKQPVSVTVGKGQTATVSFTAVGDGLTYRWYYKDKNDPAFLYSSSFTGSTYSIAVSAARDGRLVFCIVTDQYGNSVQTNIATISMAQTSITQQPVSVTVPKGQTATISFTAAGEGLTYKWYYKDKTDTDFLYSGSFTGNTYSIAVSAARDGRQVYCIVTDKYGNSVQTNTVTIKMAQITISKQPVSVSVPKGQTAVVSFTAAGEGLTYKWYYKDKTSSDFLYSGSFTGNTYSIAVSAARDGRQVYCIVTDKYGNSVKTNTVTIGMTQPVAITKQPASITVGKGQTATISFTATGDGLTYKWYYKDKSSSSFLYSGSFTGNTYSIAMSAARAGRQVYCIVTDKYGNTAKTNTVTISMAQPVTITKQPVSVSVAKGAAAKVTFTATGDGLTYKWYFKDRDADTFRYTSSFTTNTYSVAMEAARAGRQVYCVVTDKYGVSVRTDTVTLNMTGSVQISQQPVSVTAANGTRAKVTFTATGSGLTYKWYYKDRTSDSFLYSSSFTEDIYAITMSTARAGRQVYCVVTDKYGVSVKTDTVTLNMAGAVQITKQPVSVSVPKGSTAKVTFTATGDGLTYKWYYKNKSASSFTLTTSFTGNTYSTAMTDSRAGRQIYCEVTDKYGITVRTNTVTLNMSGTSAAAGSANMIPMDMRINASLTDADIPQSLRDAGFATAQSIQDALAKRLGKTDIAGMKLYNVSLMYSEDEGKTWLKAVSEHYPEDGRIIVTMPVPDGSDPTTHAYAVSHMFETNAFGKKAGGIETPEVSVFYNDEGQPMLRFETTGLSPVLVVWNAQNPQADLPATGDDSHIGASIAIMLVSLLSLAIISRKKRQTC